MKRILNPDLWWPRLQKVIELRAKAIKQHRPRRHLEAEARMIRTAIIAFENRRSVPSNRGGQDRGGSRGPPCPGHTLETIT